MHAWCSISFRSLARNLSAAIYKMYALLDNNPGARRCDTHGFVWRPIYTYNALVHDISIETEATEWRRQKEKFMSILFFDSLRCRFVHDFFFVVDFKSPFRLSFDTHSPTMTTTTMMALYSLFSILFFCRSNFAASIDDWNFHAVSILVSPNLANYWLVCIVVATYAHIWLSEVVYVHRVMDETGATARQQNIVLHSCQCTYSITRQFTL